MSTMEGKEAKSTKKTKNIKRSAARSSSLEESKYEVMVRYSDDLERLYKEKEQIYEERVQIRDDIIQNNKEQITRFEKLVDELRENIRSLVIKHDLDDEVDLKTLLCI